MQRGIIQLSQLARIQAMQPVSRTFWSATRSCSFRLPAAPTAIATYPPVRMASSTAQPSTIRFSEGEDTEQVTTGLNLLRQRGWQLDQGGTGVTKTFYFKTYFKAVVCSPFSSRSSRSFSYSPSISRADRRVEFCQCDCG